MNIILLEKPKYCFYKGKFLARLTAMLLFMFTWQTHAQTQIGADINGEAANDFSGWSVSMSADGTTVAIGAYLNDSNGLDSGHVRIYKNISGTWIQVGTEINGEAASDQSGYSVSLSSDGTIVAIAANVNDGNGTSSGHVRVYKNTAGSWTQVGADIDGEAAGDSSGWSVSLSSDGSTVAIGANANDGNGSNSGHVRVYKNTLGTWTQVGADINGEAANDQSGYSVSLSADGMTVAIGALRNSGSSINSGHVRIYKNNAGTWTQVGSDIDGEAANDESGFSVSLSSDGTTVAIGARSNDGNGAQSGHVRVYKNTAGTWTKVGTDIDGEAANDFSGWSVSLSSDGTIVAIGAFRNDENGLDAGHVRIYKNISGAWTQLGTDINGEAAGDQSGSSVSLSLDGTKVAIGAFTNDGNGSASGHVRIYDLTPLITPTAVAQTLCAGSTIANLVATGSNLKWYTTPTDVTPLATTTVLTTATYYVTQTISGTESNRTPVSVTIGGGITEWTNTGWSAGIPNSFSTVIIKADYTGPGFSACSLEILPNKFVEITSNQTLNINGLVNVAASSSLVLNDNTYLLQTQNVTNIGPIFLTKFSSPVIRLDYVAWSSPVADLNLAAFSPNTLTNRFYNYDPAGNTTATAWIPVNPLTNNFTTARGTLIRTPNNWSSTIYDNYLGMFRGVPNNGTYTPTVTPGFNLLGNPYPSAISANAFLADNTSIGSTTLYFWAHVAPIVSGAYSQNNYATYTTAGGVAAAGGGPQPNGIIPIGQGFFTNVTTAGTATFKNTQRTAATNGQSFRTNASAKESLKNTIEKHRFWLDLSSPNIPHNQMMVAYMQGSSNNLDPADGKAYQTNSNMLYTLVDNGQYVIQAKALPFADTDIVPLGFNAANAGSFTITLSQADGLFDSQEIYLKDSQLGILHNLKTAAYTFNSAVGTFNQRFEVLYTQRTLGNPTTIAADASLIIYKNANTITVKWPNTPIETVTLYDLQGRKLRTIKNTNTDTLRIENVTIVNQVVLVEVVTSEGKRSTKKLIL